jgi:hypothetical protein
MPQSTVRLFPLSPAPFEVHLVLTDAPAGATDVGPFVRLSGESGGDRAYLAVLVAAGGAEVQRLVLKIPPQELRVDDDETPPSGAVIEARWAAAQRDLTRLRASARYFPTLLLPASDTAQGSTELLPPTIFCTVHRHFFRIPCPRCFAALRTCRDDSLLARHGLPLYSLSATRFLTCPACHAAGVDDRFFATSRAEATELADKGVADLATLRRELAEAVEDARKTGTRHPSPEVYPCATGEDAGSCLGLREGSKGKSRTQVGEAAWMPFNLHDSPYLLLAHAPSSYDSFADLIGGRLPPAGASPERTAGAGYLCHQAEGSGIDAVEVFALKMALFLQVACGLREYHRLVGLPHLDLHPGHLVVEPGTKGDYLPSLWSFHARLLGTSSRRLRTLAEGVSVVLPPRDPNMTFLAPAVRSSYLIRPRSAELILERLVAVAGAKDSWHIEGRLADPQGIFPRPGPRDLFLLRWPHDLFGTHTHSAVARLDPRQPAGRSLELAIASDPVAMDPLAAHHLERAAGLRIPDVTYRCYPAFGAREDLYSLGVILLRTLLVNDQQGLEAIEGLLSALQRRDGGSQRPAPRPTREGALAWALREHGAILPKSNVFFRSLDRDAQRPNAIPDDLWASAIGLALGLTHGSGPAPAQADCGLPSVELDQVILSAEDMLRRLHTILFGRQVVNVEIQSVIAEAIAGLEPRPE